MEMNSKELKQNSLYSFIIGRQLHKQYIERDYWHFKDSLWRQNSDAGLPKFRNKNVMNSTKK